MLEAVGRKVGDWLRPDEVKTFPTSLLVAIDKLWRQYSDNKFGFSIQKRIYLDLYQSSRSQVVPSTDEKIQESSEFIDRVGWQVDGYKDLTFNLDSAPEGHLPGCWGFRFFGFGWYLMSHPGI